ncbi:TIGR03936 family radical SAM-associated protein [Sphaerochaeta sp. UBA5849]|jgi:radical SAM-linked protein|uniref:TIGR03936 family radical SAM-associated protein n=1 Tax=Sphaerochaeta sp. UBA5849 TaxID=1947475 RepID=UPI0031F56F91
MSRIRFLFSKRGLAAFVPHVEMPPLIARSARRAGMEILQTEGFSPHPKISLGPALPVGVPALAEPAEIWVGNWGEAMLDAWQRSMPRGFEILRAGPVEGPPLSRLCKAGEYRIFFRGLPPSIDELTRAIEPFLQEEKVLHVLEMEEDSARVVLAQPDRFGPGLFVKALRAAGLVEGWGDLLILRTVVGAWEESIVKPLV